MPSASYPNGEDLANYIDQARLTMPDGQPLSSAFDDAVLEEAANASMREFERVIGRQMLADSADSTRPFNPPDNPLGWLDFQQQSGGGGMVSVTSVAYQPYSSSTPQVYTVGQDYNPEPYNAPARGEPYTRIVFRQRWIRPMGIEYRGALQVTGKFGCYALLPDDVLLAMKGGGVTYLAERGGLALFRGLAKWTDIEGVSESYAQNPLQALLDGAEKAWRRGVSTYRLPVGI